MVSTAVAGAVVGMAVVAYQFLDLDAYF